MRQKLVEQIYGLHLQNLSGRETIANVLAKRSF